MAYGEHKEEKKKLTLLRKKYTELEKNIFNYKEYSLNCRGKPLLPNELVWERNKTFDEINKLTRELTRKGVMV